MLAINALHHFFIERINVRLAQVREKIADMKERNENTPTLISEQDDLQYLLNSMGKLLTPNNSIHSLTTR